jgi:hypothetical protein
MTYSGTWSIGSLTTLSTRVKNGFQIFSTTNGNYFEYTFFGNAITIELDGPSANNTFTVQIDTVLNATGVSTTGTLTNSGGGTYAFTTPDAANGVLTFSGLSLDRHTIRVTKSAVAGSLELNGLHIGTPIHYPNTKRGSLALKPAASFPKQTDVGNVDLSKAKAWVKFDSINATILSSYNVSAVLKVLTGECRVFFEKPFKNSEYILMGSGMRYATGAAQQLTIHFEGIAANTDTLPKPSNCVVIVCTNSGTTLDGTFTAAFFGELADEGEE